MVVSLPDIFRNLELVEAASILILCNWEDFNSTRSGVEMDSLDEGTGRLDEQLGVVRKSST